MTVEKFIFEIGGLDCVFKPKILNIGTDDFETNIQLMPNSREIQKLLYFRINKNEQTKKYFKNNFNCISKVPFENKSNVDLSKYIKSFVFDFDINIVSKCIYKIIYSKYINFIEDIISENRFDISWYDLGSVDYSWAIRTMEKALKQKKLFIELKKNLDIKYK
jgi:hypothetical protein